MIVISVASPEAPCEMRAKFTKWHFEDRAAAKARWAAALKLECHMLK